jgi:hypothetical protein
MSRNPNKTGTAPGSTDAPVINLNEANSFLQILDPPETDFEFRTFDDNKARGDKTLVKKFYGSLAKHADKLKRLNDLGAGVFVVINKTDGKGAEAKNIVKVRAQYTDMDGAPLEPVTRMTSHQPHMIIETSPGHWHPYWLVAGMALKDFKAVQKALIKRFKSDPNIHDLPRVMRLPGFIHRKDDPFLVSIISTNNVPPYPAADFKSVKADNTANNPYTKYGEESQSKKGRGFENILADLGDDIPKVDPQVLLGFHEVLPAAVASYVVAFQEALDPEKLKAILRDAIDKAPKNDTPQREKDIIRYKSDDFLDKLIESAIKKYRKLPKGIKLEDFIAYLPWHVFMFIPTREAWPAVSVNARIDPIALENPDGTPVVNSKTGETVKIQASAWLDKNHSAQQMTWCPGMPLEVHDRLVDSGGWFAEREPRKLALEEEMLALQRQEEFHVCKAIADGLECHRHPYASGWAILGIEPDVPDEIERKIVEAAA